MRSRADVAARDVHPLWSIDVWLMLEWTSMSSSVLMAVRHVSSPATSVIIVTIASIT